MRSFERDLTHSSFIEQLRSSVGSTATSPSSQGPAQTALVSSSPIQISKSVGSIIGKDLTISGQDLKITSSGVLQIDGDVHGELNCVELIVNEQARVTGKVNADTVVVRGHVVGEIHGTVVSLLSTAHVEGDIKHVGLSMQPGAVFDGRSQRAQQVEAAE
jgi:cytoskeletal protein CcmA (bactofilin family)